MHLSDHMPGGISLIILFVAISPITTLTEVLPPCLERFLSTASMSALHNLSLSSDNWSGESKSINDLSLEVLSFMAIMCAVLEREACCSTFVDEMSPAP